VSINPIAKSKTRLQVTHNPYTLQYILAVIFISRFNGNPESSVDVLKRLGVGHSGYTQGKGRNFLSFTVS
jgi:hypothetical protein